MAQKFYLDTCIWRDYFEDRKDGIRPLGEFAFQFLKKSKGEKSVILVSDIVLGELAKELSEDHVKTMFSGFEEIVVFINHSKGQAQEARVLLKKFEYAFPFADILHCILARDEGAVMMTRDKHFWEIGLVDVFMPEDLL